MGYNLVHQSTRETPAEFESDNEVPCWKCGTLYDGDDDGMKELVIDNRDVKVCEDCRVYCFGCGDRESENGELHLTECMDAIWHEQCLAFAIGGDEHIPMTIDEYAEILRDSEKYPLFTGRIAVLLVKVARESCEWMREWRRSDGTIDVFAGVL
jgi:hypothetical protein